MIKYFVTWQAIDVEGARTIESDIIERKTAIATEDDLKAVTKLAIDLFDCEEAILIGFSELKQ